MVSTAQLLLNFALPGVGGTIYDAIKALHDMYEKIEGDKTKCAQVIERIESFLGVLQGIQDAKQLEHNPALPRLATTITKFQALLQEHAKKHTLSRFFTRHELDEQILSFHTQIDHLFQMLNLVHMAEADGWRKRFEENQAQDHQLALETNTNVCALVSEYKGQNSIREAALLMKFGIAERSQSHRFSREDRAWMQQTLNAMTASVKLPVEDLPAWYLPSEDVTCPNEEFDRGTYGAVYRGTWNGAHVVIKRLLMIGDRVETSFFNEAKVWSEMNHPYVVKLYGACHVSSPLFFVCEDAPNGNFAEFFKVQKNKQQLWRRFHEAALGLAYLHSAMVVHGDLKCTNLLIGANGRTRICDFGFSYIRNASKGLSEKARTDAVRWTAPECFEEVNPPFESDIYSLALCIIEAVSGKLPWGDMEDEAIVDKLDKGEGHERPEGFSERQWEVIQGMAAIKRADRTPLIEALKLLDELASEEKDYWRSAAVTQECSQCQTKASGTAKFCSECAHPFA